MPHEENLTRRRVVMRGIGVVFGFIGAAVVVPLVGYFVGPAARGMSSAAWSPLGRAIPPTPRSSEPWVRVGDLGSFAQDMPTLVTVRIPAQDGLTQGDTPVAVYVRRTAADGATIFDVHCTHMGCSVEWNPGAQRFLCPCHGGVFDTNSRVLSGPAPRPLDRYATKVDGAVLYVGGLDLPGA